MTATDAPIDGASSDERATIGGAARLASVSIATVSRVVNGRYGVPGTNDRARAAIEERLRGRPHRHRDMSTAVDACGFTDPDMRNTAETGAVERRVGTSAVQTSSLGTIEIVTVAPFPRVRPAPPRATTEIDAPTAVGAPVPGQA